MVTFLVLFQLCIVLALIFIGARVGGIGLGIYGMVGVFILVFIFGMHPGKIPIDVMLIIASNGCTTGRWWSGLPGRLGSEVPA